MIKYRTFVQELLTEIQADSCSSLDNDIETQIVFDTDRDRYLLIDVGWQGKTLVYGTLVHIDIKGGKIWIQQNNTDIRLVE